MLRGDEDETFAYVHNLEMIKCRQPQIVKGMGCVSTFVNDYVDDV